MQFVKIIGIEAASKGGNLGVSIQCDGLKEPLIFVNCDQCIRLARGGYIEGRLIPIVPDENRPERFCVDWENLGKSERIE